MLQGTTYLIRGFKMLGQPGIRLFVIIPLIINCLIFALFISLGVSYFSHWIDQLMAWLPAWEWLDFLRWLLWPLVITLLLSITTYAFSMAANFIAAPFNGLLAEKVEELISGKEVNANETVIDAIKDAPRSIGKEVQKLVYYFPRALLASILSLVFMFIFPPLVTIIWFVLGAWMMAIQYCDYPMDNHRMSLAQVRALIGTTKLNSFGFGAAVMFGTMIPVVNFIVMPAAVCGATIYWVEMLSEVEA